MTTGGIIYNLKDVVEVDLGDRFYSCGVVDCPKCGQRQLNPRQHPHEKFYCACGAVLNVDWDCKNCQQHSGCRSDLNIESGGGYIAPNPSRGYPRDTREVTK